MQKRSFHFLLSLLALLFLLAACTAVPAAPADSAAGEQPETSAAADAADDMDDGVVEITYTYARTPQIDQQLVEDALNEIITPKIGVKLILEPIDGGVYNDKMQLRLASGEHCDIIFTAPWINSYTNNVSNGVLAGLDELLPKYAPGLWASMPETTWNAARVNGTIYGVINQQIFPKPWGVHIRKDMLEKYDFSLDGVERWEDMEPFLVMVRDQEGITPIYTVDTGNGLYRPSYYGHVELGTNRGITVYAADENMQVVSLLETPEYKAAADLTKKWVDEGYFMLEGPPADEAASMFKAGLFAMSYHVEKPGNEIEAQNRFGWEFVSKNLTDPLILDTGGATATLNAVCAVSPHPEKAVQVLELFNTDPDVYNTLARGIQGKHWVWEDEANQVMRYPDDVSAETSTYNPNGDWMFGNQFNAYYRDVRQVGAWEKTKEMNDTAFPATTLGYAVDPSNIKTELAQVSAVWKELVTPIEYGWVAYDDAAPEAMAKLQEAGLQTIIDEVQSQVDAWAETK